MAVGHHYLNVHNNVADIRDCHFAVIEAVNKHKEIFICYLE
ncbi:aminotransferase [Acinetobacter baumannii]|nr:aminotransferase [Acinetobacter baumannii]